MTDRYGLSHLSTPSYGQSETPVFRSRDVSTSEERSSEGTPAVVMLFGVATVVILIGTVLAFTTGDAREFSDGDEEHFRRGVGNRDTEGVPTGPIVATVVPIVRVPVPQGPSDPASQQPGSPAFHRRSGLNPQPRAGVEEDSPGSPASEELRPGLVAPPASTVSTQRPGITVCVVGKSFASASLFSGGWCDYAIYPDLEVIASEFAPRHGQSSWRAFKKAIALQPNMGAGVSFSPRNLGNSVSTVASLTRMSGKLVQLVRTMNISAMGVLNFQRHLGASTNTLAAAFKVMDAALKQQSYTEGMTFLGAVLVNKQSRTDFVNEVYNMQHLTTIIVQTHLHGDPEPPPNVSSTHQCRVFPVSAIHAQSPHQDFKGAVDVVYTLRMNGDKFRLLFSSTMAVMMFVGAAESGAPKMTYDLCERAFMVDYDVTCNATVTSGRKTYDHVNKYAYVTFRDGGRNYFAAYESEESLTAKLSRYVRTFSDGWAMFEVQRDVWKSCLANDYIRLELIAINARYNTSSTLTASHGR